MSKKKVFFVGMMKLGHERKVYHQVHIEAQDAREAFEKVDAWTGTYKIESVNIREEMDHSIYPARP